MHASFRQQSGQLAGSQQSACSPPFAWAEALTAVPDGQQAGVAGRLLAPERPQPVPSSKAPPAISNPNDDINVRIERLLRLGLRVSRRSSQALISACSDHERTTPAGPILPAARGRLEPAGRPISTAKPIGGRAVEDRKQGKRNSRRGHPLGSDPPTLGQFLSGERLRPIRRVWAVELPRRRIRPVVRTDTTTPIAGRHGTRAPGRFECRTAFHRSTRRPLRHMHPMPLPAPRTERPRLRSAFAAISSCFLRPGTDGRPFNWMPGRPGSHPRNRRPVYSGRRPSVTWGSKAGQIAPVGKGGEPNTTNRRRASLEFLAP
jgi:hypothetical protein